jgi:Holliday junction resolvase
MSSAKGDRWERHYVNALSADDPDDDSDDVERVGIDDFALVEPFTALRLPASGAGRSADLPDIHAWLCPDAHTVRQYAAESKAGADRVYLDNDEVDALVRYADDTGATPVVFVHIDHEHAHDDLGGDYVVAIDELHSTASGYTFTKTRDAPTARTFAEWVDDPQSVA